MNNGPIEPSELTYRILSSPHRTLDPMDLSIIFQDASGWWLFYALLLCSGMRIDDAALLTPGNIDRSRSIIGTFCLRSERYYELPFLPALLNHIPLGQSADEPLFSTLYCDVEDKNILEDQLNDNLAQPSDYLKALLSAQGRPVASLMALRMTFDEVVKPLLDDLPNADKWFNQTCRPNSDRRAIS